MAAWRKIAFLTALSAVAAPAPALTIEEAFAEAVRSNPQVRAARDAARILHEDVPLAFSAFLPSLQANASASRTRIGTTTTQADPEVTSLPVTLESGIAKELNRFLPETEKIGPNTQVGSAWIPFPRTGTGSDSSDQQSLELVYTQNLYRSGRDEAALRQAEDGVRQSHAGIEDTEQNVLLRVATAYLDVLRAERTVELRKASLTAFEARARETRAQFRVGDRTAADVAQAEAEQVVAAADVVSAQAALEVQRALFLALVGMPAEDLEAAGEPAGLPETLDVARHAAQARRPAVRAAMHAEMAAAHAVRVAKGELGPRVDLRATLTRTVGHGTSRLNSTDRSIGVQLGMPLYQAGRGGARLRQARHRREQLRDRRLAAQREALQRATSAWLNLHAARQRQAALETAIMAARVALDGIRREAAIGERTTREVLDAERNLVSYQVRVLSAERDAVVEAYALLEATGALTARRLGIGDLPDLDREARETSRNLEPGYLSLD